MNYSKASNINETTFEDLKPFQELTSEEHVLDLIGVPVILNRHTEESRFNYLLEHTVDIAAMCWGNKTDRGLELQHTMIKFKVDVEDKFVYELPLNRFMISLIFLRPLMKYINEIDVDQFLIYEALTNKKRIEIQDRIVNVLFGYGYIMEEVKGIISFMSKELKEILLIFSHATMQVFTAENLFIDHYRNSKLIRDINNTEYPQNMQTADIVKENAKKYELLKEEMTKLGNPLFLDDKYISMLKPKQLEELFINFSQIPDGKNIIPVIMNGNGFKSGYHDLAVFYAGAIAARVPDIMNEEYMGLAGYFGRNLWILTYGTISKTVYDCGSVNPIPITVDEHVLRMMDGRFYYEDNNCGSLKVLKSTDTHLIDKTLWFRSPCTCNLNEDCCHVCYGTKALHVGDLPGGFIYTTELLSKDVGQKILSAKHLLKTNSEKIIIEGEFDKYFENISSTIMPKDDKRFDIYIPEDYQDNISDNLTIYVGKDMQKIVISHYANIYIPDNVIKKSKSVVIDDITYYKITSFRLNEIGGELCTITPINIMMTAKYMDMMKLFENDIVKFEKIEDIVVYLMRLLDGTIPILSTHGEIIIGRLLRRVDNELLRPNWLNPDEPYQIMRLKTALGNIEGFGAGLASEQTTRHIKHSIFDKRNKIKRVGPHSFIDFFYGDEQL